MTPTRVRPPVPRIAFSQQEAAEALGVSVSHFARHIKPELPVVYSGDKRLYSLASLERYLADHAERGRQVA